MTPLVSIHSLSKSFGTQRLFDRLSLVISRGDRIGLIGPNGSGKSTLIKIIAKLEDPDSGSLSYRQGVQIGYASQSPEFPHVPLLNFLVESVHQGNQQERQTRATILLGKMGFKNPQQNASELSGGWKKRLDLARALMSNPDLLLLDEPTNHLDLEGIIWLEQFLNREKLTFLVISHDRYFLDNVTNRILEINKCYPDGLLAAKGSFSDFMEQRAEFLAGQEQRQRSIASQVRAESEWLRRSPKARTTKSLSRVQRAYALMDELGDLQTRNRKERAELSFESSERETRKLLTAKNISKSIGDKLLFKNLDITLSPRMRLGIVGANGTGKTTLLKILAHQLKPDMGTIKFADDLRLVYFDQHREELSPDLTLRYAMAPNGETVTYRGVSIHVNGWAKRFLFSPDRLELPIRCLSGGERARIFIARLMLQPADILFLDEPTNDLDIPTLEVIEESLADFPGAVVLVTHDRCLMDRVATHIIGLGSGCDSRLFSDYAQWEEAAKLHAISVSKPEPKKAPSQEKPLSQKKLSYHEQKELAGLPEAIEKLEKALHELHRELDDKPSQAPIFYQELDTMQKKLEVLYKRWEELEQLS